MKVKRSRLADHFCLLPSTFYRSLSHTLSDAIATRADHRLDELTVRVLIAAAHQLRESLAPIGSIVVAAGEIERSQGIVDGTNNKKARHAPGCELRHVSHGRRLGRSQVLAYPTAAIEPAGRERVRAGRFRRRRYQEHLRDSEVRQFFKNAGQAPRPLA